MDTGLQATPLFLGCDLARSANSSIGLALTNGGG